MPIRPEKKKLYPPRAEWERIRERVLERAGENQSRPACECRGECEVVEHNGGRCDAPHGALVVRTHHQVPGFVEVESWREHHHTGACMGEPCESSEMGSPVVRVVLTISHLDHDPTNNDLENLRAFCQRCHLRYDRHEHAKNARATRAKKAGQGGLFE